MSEEHSVKSLKSRFEQLHAPSTSSVTTSPASHATALTENGQKAALKTRPLVPAKSPAKTGLSEREGYQGAPRSTLTQSTGLTTSLKHPPLPGNKPTTRSPAGSDGFTMPTAVSITVSEESEPSRTLIHGPTSSAEAASNTSYSASTKLAPPPPPSPRVRSPRPSNHSSHRSTSGATAIRVDVERSDDHHNLLKLQQANRDDSLDEERTAGLATRDYVCQASPTRLDSRPRKYTDTLPTFHLPGPRTDSYCTNILSESRSPTPSNLSYRTEQFDSRPVPRNSENAEKPKPVLPIRPMSLQQGSATLSTREIPVEISSAAEDKRPPLPKRTETIEIMPLAPRRETVKLDTPKLPLRPAKADSAVLANYTAARQSLQHERTIPINSLPERLSLDAHVNLSSREHSSNVKDDSDGEEDGFSVLENARSLDQPDSSAANRKAPRFKGANWEFQNGKEIKKILLSGDLMIVACHDKIKIHNILTNEIIWQIPFSDTKVTAIGFRTEAKDHLADAGRFLWVGFKDGSLHELDLRNHLIVERLYHAHSSSLVTFLYHQQSMWTLDEAGNLQIRTIDSSSSLSRPNCRSIRTVIGISAAVVATGLIWIGSGRTVHVFNPSLSSNPRLTPDRGLEPNRLSGNITCAVYLKHDPDHVYFGHDDGKISMYSLRDLRCIDVISVSHYNLSSLLEVGDYLWASFKTGKIFVYDISHKPWRVLKEWQAHKSPIIEMNVDRYGLWKEKRLQVSSLGSDGSIRIWDGLLMEDWLDGEMERRLKEFSTFNTVSAIICTWNAGASLPQRLSRQYEDSRFIENMIQQAESPDLIIFGFQELVDLDDKGKAGRSVAKGFFGGKKKEKLPDERTQAAAYQLWQAYLENQVALAAPQKDSYKLLHVRNLVGLFSCVFVRQTMSHRIGNVSASSVKTGLNGRYGNKGGIVIRLTIDDTSMCFVNCHLAAGQKHVTARNNDVFSILDQAGLPASENQAVNSNVFVCGGDGSKVLDHEICILNGDLNYRINGTRSQVLQCIKEGRLNNLLEKDQLLLELKKNPTHRLRSFTESPIRFNPTYKYDPGTDVYDSSEKMRIPAWCDRIYFRGKDFSKVEAHSYQAHVCRVSDHRPVSAILSMQVKTIDTELRKRVYERVARAWIDLTNETILLRKIAVLQEITGRSDRTCREELEATRGQIVSDAAMALLS